MPSKSKIFIRFPFFFKFFFQELNGSFLLKRINFKQKQKNEDKSATLVLVDLLFHLNLAHQIPGNVPQLLGKRLCDIQQLVKFARAQLLHRPTISNRALQTLTKPTNQVVQLFQLVPFRQQAILRHLTEHVLLLQLPVNDRHEPANKLGLKHVIQLLKDIDTTTKSGY